jgi:hypothetical protein
MLKINFKKLKQNYFNIFQNKKYFKKLLLLRPSNFYKN